MSKKVIIVISLLLIMGCTNPSSEVLKITQKIYPDGDNHRTNPPDIFKSDGCSLWFDSVWVDCCVKHDLLYWRGGNRNDRKATDLAFKECVAASGHPLFADLMYFGVRAGGVGWLPTPFRWGFGWDFPQTGPPNQRNRD